MGRLQAEVEIEERKVFAKDRGIAVAIDRVKVEGLLIIRIEDSHFYAD